MSVLGVFLLVTPERIYSAYPASDQAVTGDVMIVMMLVMDLTLAPLSLYHYFGQAPPKPLSH